MLEGGLKGASRGLEGGLKPSEGEGGFKGASRGLERGFKGALEGGFTFGRLQGGSPFPEPQDAVRVCDITKMTQKNSREFRLVQHC